MIILEGPDGSGKTSLAHRLSADLSLPIATKVVDHETNATTDLVKWVQWNLDDGLTRTLYDRHRLISEPIYGPLIRGRMVPGFDDFQWLRTMQRAFRQLKPLVIWCLPPLELVIKNVEGDELNTVVESHIEVIYWLYHNEAARWSGQHSYLWNYERHNYTGLRSLVVDWLDKKGLKLA